MAFIPQFIEPGASDIASQYVVMGTTTLIADLIVMAGYSCLAAQLARWIQTENNQIIQNRFFGGLFMCAAVLLAGYRSS